MLTTGTLNSGLVVTSLWYMFRKDMSNSISSIFQEVGRVGQRKDAIPKTDIVDFLITSIGYRFLLRQA